MWSKKLKYFKKLKLKIDNTFVRTLLSNSNFFDTFPSFSFAFSSYFVSKFLTSDCKNNLSLFNKPINFSKSIRESEFFRSLVWRISRALLCWSKVVRRSLFCAWYMRSDFIIKLAILWLFNLILCSSIKFYIICYLIISYIILYYITLYILCYIISSYVILYHIKLCFIKLCYIISYYVILSYVISCYIMLYYIILYYIMLYYIMLYYIILCYVVSCYVILCVMVHYVISYNIIYYILL